MEKKLLQGEAILCICGMQKSMPECTATEIHRMSDDDFSRNTAAVSLEFCQILENVWHLKKPSKVKGDGFRGMVTELEVGTVPIYFSERNNHISTETSLLSFVQRIIAVSIMAYQ